jgi:hypothetical protein
VDHPGRTREHREEHSSDAAQLEGVVTRVRR